MLVTEEYELEIASGTRQVVACGQDLLQIFRIHPEQGDHCDFLLDVLELPENAVVADMGAGLGAVAREWTRNRPDLRFKLVNNNRWQCEHATGA